MSRENEFKLLWDCRFKGKPINKKTMFDAYMSGVMSKAPKLFMSKRTEVTGRVLLHVEKFDDEQRAVVEVFEYAALGSCSKRGNEGIVVDGEEYIEVKVVV